MTWQSACAVPATPALLCAHAALVLPPVMIEAAAKVKAKADAAAAKAAAEAAKKGDTAKAKAVAAAGKKGGAAKADAAAAKAQAEAAVAREDAANRSPAKGSSSAKETSPKTAPAKKGSTKVRRPHRQLATLMMSDGGHIIMLRVLRACGWAEGRAAREGGLGGPHRHAHPICCAADGSGQGDLRKSRGWGRQACWSVGH